MSSGKRRSSLSFCWPDIALPFFILVGAEVDGRVINDLLDGGVKSALVEEEREVAKGVWKSSVNEALSALAFELVLVIVPVLAISIMDISSIHKRLESKPGRNGA